MPLEAISTKFDNFWDMDKEEETTYQDNTKKWVSWEGGHHLCLCEMGQRKDKYKYKSLALWLVFYLNQVK